MAAEDSLRPEQFGFKPPIERERLWEIEDHPKLNSISGFGGSKRMSIKPGTFRASQDYINAGQVEHYAAHGWSSASRAHGSINIVKHAGEHVVFNGHHRLAAALQRGQKRTRVWLTDLDEK